MSTAVRLQPREALDPHQGQLVSAWAVQVKAHVSRHCVANGLLVDMSDVLWLRDLQAKFVTETCYARDICERLHLNHKGDADGSVPSVTEVHPPPAPPPPPGRSLLTRLGAAPLKETPNIRCSISTNPKPKLEKICSE
jgi:hypothetical protein